MGRHITIEFEDDELALVDRLAAQSGESRAGFILRAVREAEDRHSERPSGEDYTYTDPEDPSELEKIAAYGRSRLAEDLAGDDLGRRRR